MSAALFWLDALTCRPRVQTVRGEQLGRGDKNGAPIGSDPIGDPSAENGGGSELELLPVCVYCLGKSKKCVIKGG